MQGERVDALSAVAVVADHVHLGLLADTLVGRLVVRWRGGAGGQECSHGSNRSSAEVNGDAAKALGMRLLSG